MNEEVKMIPHILRDVTDGVLVLDRQGTILFLNPSGRRMLEFGPEAVGQKYAAVMLQKNQKGNDSFHQFLLDSLDDSENTHKGEIVYTKSDGTEINLRMTTSFLFDESGENYQGVVVQFADITEIVRLRRKQEESSTVFIAGIVYVCFWVFFYTVWDLLGRPLSEHILTQVVQALGVLVFLFILKNTSFTRQDMGLGTKNLLPAIRTDTVIAAVGLGLLILLKLVLIRVVPDFFGTDAPFFNLKLGWSEIFYPFVVVLQEFLTRSVMHENLRRVIAGKNKEWAAIFVSTILFGVLHIHMGIVYMVGAMILLGALGMLYRKQGTIWGLCIPHYVLGLSLTILGFA